MMPMQYLHAHFEGYLANTFANAYWKDAQGLYLGTNDVFLRVSGVESHHNIIGTSDKDQVWYKQADQMMENDRRVILTEQVSTTIENALVPDGGIIQFISHKTPLRAKSGKVIGVLGLSFGLETQDWNQDRLNEVSMVVGIHGVEHVKRFLLREKQGKYKLSKRQLECLYYLTKGMTIKQIASNLSLSNRTVEHYLEAVKSKMGCVSRSELISKAYDYLNNATL